MLADQAEEPADSRILEKFGLDDLDNSSLKQYRQRFASRTPDHPWLSEDDKGFLTKLGGWRRDRSTNQEGVTVAGLLMFGKMEAIQEPEAIPEFNLDYREKPADPSDIRWTDRLTLDGTWAGNIFQFYQRVIQKLSADLKIPFQLGPDLFRKDDTIVHEAVREALVNALIHADYRGQGGVVIDKYPDHFEFSNPGSLLISILQLLQGGISECRNKSLQRMFQMIGGGEKAGSGIDKIRQGWASQHWRSPGIQEQQQPDRVRLVLPMISILPESSVKILSEQFGEPFKQLNPEEVQAVVTAQLEGEVTNRRMQEMCGRHPSDLTKILQGLVRQGFLTPEGQGRGTRYVLPVLPDKEGIIQPDIFDVSLGTYRILNSPQSGADSPQSGADSPQSDADSPQSDVWDSSQNLSELNPTELKKLRDIVSPIASSLRSPKQETRRILAVLCERKFLTAAHLAELTQRSVSNLRDRFLSPMVREGILELRYPNKLNRPDQAYRTVHQSSHLQEK